MQQSAYDVGVKFGQLAYTSAKAILSGAEEFNRILKAGAAKISSDLFLANYKPFNKKW